MKQKNQTPTIESLSNEQMARCLEAAAGKNAISHVGKLYNVLALEAAKAIVEQVEGVRQAQVFLLSQIGRPLNSPFVAAAAVQPARQTLDSNTIGEVQAVLTDCLSQVDKIRKRLSVARFRCFSAADA
jgi:S-adenosylmethionine synthetase